MVRMYHIERLVLVVAGVVELLRRHQQSRNREQPSMHQTKGQSLLLQLLLLT